MFHQGTNPAGAQSGQTVPDQPKLPVANADWVKKILKESIYVDVCEAEKTLSFKDIILDGIDYTVHWRCKVDHGRKQRKTKDRIALYGERSRTIKAAGGDRSRPISATSKGRKRKKH